MTEKSVTEKNMRSDWLSESLFSGDVAFITGAGSGINQGIAQMFAAHGAKVVIVGRRQEKLDETCELIRKAGGEAMGISADVRDLEAMSAAAEQGAKAYGPYTLVVAGAAGNFMAPFDKISSNGFSSVVDIDLKGTFHTLKAASAHFAESNVRCLAITAPQSQMAMPMQSHVCAAKAGVDMLIKTLSLEWGRKGVRINALSPGFVEGTVGGDLVSAGQGDNIKRLLPLNRFASVKEMAQMATVMVSPLTAYLTGQVVALDGGISLLGPAGMMGAAGG
ncbi:MAG: SDR family oxidoreductase [Gammaproteobacteria bacterium]|nr:SDR family oxidoreductase [Gammaproteobacteria bacterium]MBQ0774786.1 SDR family oxidoreductase [Gammaproteobacteria bacterium]